MNTSKQVKKALFLSLIIERAILQGSNPTIFIKY